GRPLPYREGSLDLRGRRCRLVDNVADRLDGRFLLLLSWFLLDGSMRQRNGLGLYGGSAAADGGPGGVPDLQHVAPNDDRAEPRIGRIPARNSPVRGAHEPRLSR